MQRDTICVFNKNKSMTHSISRFTAFAIVVCCLIALAVPSMTRAETYTVDSLTDAVDANVGDGICETAGAECTLRAAVQEANQGGVDTISIPAGTYTLSQTGTSEDSSVTGDLDFTDTDLTTVIGAGSDLTIIDANDIDRVLTVHSGAAVELQDIAITNGNAGVENGGGILNTGNLAVYRSLINSNEAFGGGGIHTTTSTTVITTITDTTFDSNIATDAGGGLRVDGAEGDNALTMNRVTFTSNQANSGGGIWADAPMDLTNGTIVGNSSVDAGGGFGANPDSDSPVVRIAFTTIAQNTSASNTGNGVYADNLIDFRIKGSILSDNQSEAYQLNCYGIVTSEDYNFFGGYDTLGCTINDQANDVISVDSGLSYIGTAIVGDNGGYVETLAAYGEQTLDIVPVLSCTDATGSALITDARGYHRPENTNCDLGSFELQTGPAVVTSLVAVPSGSDIELSWTNPADSDFDSVMIRRSPIGFPANTSDGTLVATDIVGTSYSDTSLSDSTYYYSVFAKDTLDNYSDATTASATVDTVTETPTLISPASSSIGNMVNIEYTLPEAPLTGSVQLIFTHASSSVVAFAMQDDLSVDITFNPTDSGNQVNLDNIATINAILPSAMPVLPDGVYTVTLQYQDALGNSVASATSSAVIVDTTTVVPVVVSPTASSKQNSLNLHYTLPEVPSSGTVEVTLSDGSTDYVLQMDDTQTVNVDMNLANPSATSHVNHTAVDAIPDETYSVTVVYQDVYGNPSSTTTVSNVILDRVAPLISLVGDSSVSIAEGSVYTDSGAEAIDAVDGDISDDIVTTNPVNTAVPDVYTVSYAVTDAAGNEATVATRTVTVVAVVENDDDADDVDDDSGDDEEEIVTVPQRVAASSVVVRKNKRKRIVRWTAVDDATTYRIRIQNRNKKTKLLKSDITATKYTLKPKWLKNHLVKGKKYRIQIKACNIAGCSTWSKVKSWQYK